MIKYTETTIFNAPVQTIVNTVNCVGFMGAGLALECRLRFPEMYEDYVKRCRQKTVQIGKPYVYRGYEKSWIINFPTKNHWKFPSKIEWIDQGLDYFVKKYETGGITSVAFPKLGCDKGGLNWDEVRCVMEKYLNNLNIDVYICLDTELTASGIEGLMVDLINNKENPFWITELKIRDSTANKILDQLPIKRFRDLNKFDGISKETYHKIFELLYDFAQKNNCEANKQTKLNLNEPEAKQLELNLTF